MEEELFFIDKSDQPSLLDVDHSEARNAHDSDDDDNDIDLDGDFDIPPSIFQHIKTKRAVIKKKHDSNDIYSLQNTYFDCGPITSVDKLMEKSVMKPGFEKPYSGPMPLESKRKLQKERKIARDKTKGKNWFLLPATKVTDEIKNDLDILKMRSVLDPKHVYKKNDITVTPKYFQVGKVMEGSAEFYSSRIPKSQRKRTIVDELLADSECRTYQKKKFKEIMDEGRRKKGKKAHAMAKKLKNKKK